MHVSSERATRQLRAELQPTLAAAPVAAVQLREEPVEEWGVLLRTEGVFMLRAWLRKGGEVITHFITFNAGTRVLYLGPWVWLVEEKDLCDLERLAHDIEMRHGIFLNEGSTCRRIWFEPAHAAALQLPYNVPEEVRAVRGALGVGLSKYARKRKRERESESTDGGGSRVRRVRVCGNADCSSPPGTLK